MRATTEKYLSKAYACKPKDLHRLVHIAFRENNALRYEVECTDGSSLYPQTLDELLSLSNPAARAINKLTIRSGRKADTSILFVLENDDSSTGFYSVEGDDKDVYIISRDIEECLDAMTQHFSFFSVGEHTDLFSPILLYLCGGTSLALLILIFVELLKRPLESHEMAKLMNIILVWALFLVFSLFFTKIRKNLFPPVSFCIGDGENRFERNSSRRKQLGFSAIVALCVGIIGSLIANALTYK